MGAVFKLEPDYRTNSMEFFNAALNKRLARKEEAAFEETFKLYFKRLHAYAFTLVQDDADAEEIVQQVFFKLWDRAGKLNLGGSVPAYLYRSVHNESLNYLKHLRVRSEHRMHVVHRAQAVNDPGNDSVVSKELEQQLKKALDELPEQCRTIFQLSRFEELKYREIAERLQLSVKTVENQVSKALKILRTRLVDYLTLLYLLVTI